LVKCSSGDPLMPVLFARSLARHDPELGECLAAVRWRGGDEAVEAAAFESVDVIEAFGHDDTLESIASRLPAGRRLVRHGHKVSFAVVRSPLGPVEAAGIARDVAMFDQQGCLSVQTVFVLGGAGDARGAAHELAGACAHVENELPAGARSMAQAAAVQRVRAQYEFRPGADIWASPASTAWTVVLAAPNPLPPTVGVRTVFVCPVQDAAELGRILRPKRHVIQAIGLGPGVTLDELELGFTPWTCRAGQMQRPPMDWLQDGEHLLRQLAGIKEKPA
jgi:acyl-CoA reductase LuxC